MQHLKTFSLVISFLLFGGLMYAQDTTYLFGILKQNEKKLKLQKSRVIKKIKYVSYPDSLEIYHQNNKKNQITIIQVNTSKSANEKEFISYWYLDNKVFKIIVSCEIRFNAEKIKKYSCLYFFSNDNLIYGSADTDASNCNEVNSLLMSAKKYLEKGNLLLQ